MASPILVTKTLKGVCVLTLNRPEKRNALDGLIIQEWIQILEKVEKDNSIRIVMVNGNGDNFCAGADIGWMQKMSKSSKADNVEDALQLAKLLHKIYNFPKPVIGLIHGATMGGGLGVSACCDMVIAASNSIFCFSEAKMGLTPSVISPYVLPVFGERLSRYYFLTAEKFNAEKAVELRLVQEIVPVEKLMESGLLLAGKLLSNSLHALTQAKKLIKYVSQKPISDEIMQWTAEHLAFMRASADADEGLKAFLEKRSPVWE